MAWRRTGDKALFEPMMAHIADAYMRRLTSANQVDINWTQRVAILTPSKIVITGGTGGRCYDNLRVLPMTKSVMTTLAFQRTASHSLSWDIRYSQSVILVGKS